MTPVRRVVVMGVAGCGKSTLAAALAAALDARLIEGDDHHLPASQDKMRRGVALQDSDREPWLDELGRLAAAGERSVVLTCSALKQRYRDRLRRRVPGLQFVFLDIAPAAAAQRVRARSGHLFPEGLVGSQFDDLEPPRNEPGVVTVPASFSPPQQLDLALAGLGAARPASPRPASEPVTRA